MPHIPNDFGKDFVIYLGGEEVDLLQVIWKLWYTGQFKLSELDWESSRLLGVY